MDILPNSAPAVQVDPALHSSTPIDSQAALLRSRFPKAASSAPSMHRRLADGFVPRQQAARLAREQHLKAGICRRTKEPTHDSC